MFSTRDILQKKAILVIFSFGIISLLGDTIYEGARSINGTYLKLLGSTAGILGLIIGFGEFLGYAVRLVSGYLSDRIKTYWFFVFLGYGLLAVIPLLGITNSWKLAALFIITERIGKGLRSPSKSTILSYATKQIGTGIGFGIVEFMDQIGATLGPLIFTYSFMSSKQNLLDRYHNTYLWLFVPYAVLMLSILLAYLNIKKPEKLEKQTKEQKTPKIFWLYTIFSFFTTAGFVGFALIAYHIKTLGLMDDAKIAGLYAIAMFVDAIFAIFIGYIYDKIKKEKDNEHAGILVMLLVPFLTILSLIFAFSNSITNVLIGIILWGIVMSMHETIMKASTADITHISKRGSAYGIFTVIYGIGLFIANTIAGLMYSVSIGYLIITLSVIELLSLIFFKLIKNELVS